MTEGESRKEGILANFFGLSEFPLPKSSSTLHRIPLSYFIRNNLPHPVFSWGSCGVNLNIAFGVPAAAQISLYCRRSSSIKIRICWTWPTGGIPPMANPVFSRTNSASAFAKGSVMSFDIFFSLTRFAPLVATRIGCCVSLPLKKTQASNYK